MADALASGASEGNLVGVQVPPRPPPPTSTERLWSARKHFVKARLRGVRRAIRPTVRGVTKRGRHGRHPKGGRVTPKGTRPAGAPGPSWSTQDAEPDLMRNLGRKLRSGDPLDVLAEVSSLLTLVDPREYGFGRRDGEPPWSLRELVDMFLDVARIETSALLAVIAELAGDDVLAARIRRELAERADRLPEWLARLGEAEVYRAQEMVHVLGDGDNVHVAVRFTGGAELTAVVYIDHNMGTLVKDAFVVPESMAELEVFMRAKVDDPDTSGAISTWPTPGCASPRRSSGRR